MSSSRRSVALLAVLPSLTLVLAAAPASAHTELVSATPGPGVMVNGAVIASGSPEAVRSSPEVQRVYLGEAHA